MKNIYLRKKVTSAVNFIRRVLETVQPVKTIKKNVMYSDHNVIEIFPGQVNGYSLSLQCG